MKSFSFTFFVFLSVSVYCKENVTTPAGIGKEAAFLFTFIRYTNAMSEYPTGNEKKHHTSLDAFSIIYARKGCWENAALSLKSDPVYFDQNSKKILDDAETISSNMASLLSSQIVGLKKLVDNSDGNTQGEAERNVAELKEQEGQLQTAYNQLVLRVYGEILDTAFDKKGNRHLRITSKEKQMAEAMLKFSYGDKLKTATEKSIMAWNAKLFYDAMSRTKTKDE